MGMLLRRHKEHNQATEENKVVTTPVMGVGEPDAELNRTQVNRMSVDDLRSLAESKGIEDANVASGSTLKKLLIEKLGL